MELVFAALVSGVISVLVAFGVAYMNRKTAKVAVDAAVYTRSEAHLNNVIAQQDRVLKDQTILIQNQDVKINHLEEDNRNLKASLWEAQMNNKKLEVRIDDLEKKMTGF